MCPLGDARALPIPADVFREAIGTDPALSCATAELQEWRLDGRRRSPEG